MRYIYLLLLVFLFSFCSQKTKQAVAQTDATVKTLKEKETINSLLWEISGKELSKPSYLYGTIHMIDKDDYFLTDATKVAFDKSEKVAFEINMEEMSDMSVIFSLMGKIMMADGTTLKDLLSEEDYDFVKKKFKEMGLPIAMLGRMKPMFLSTFAAGAEGGGGEPGGMGMMGGDMVSYEMKFMEMAQTNQKEMAGLETIDFQLSMFDSIPYKAQAEMLVKSLKASSEGADQLKEMVDLYKNQDIEGMQTMFNAEQGGLDGYQDVLLVQRNENWIPIMEDMMTEQITFFAVGAGHLGGEKGVIDLLKEAGYTLKPLF